MTANIVKKPLVILTGPTAAGKTKLSIALAKAIGGEIISADSMQVYRHMDIGSAKIRVEEMQGVCHHLIDILEPTEDFNVVLFQRLAFDAMEKIYTRGHIPILVGGTGFYIQAILYAIDFTKEGTDKTYREALEQIAKEQGNHVLHEKLRQVDPVSADAIHENNVKRVIRALEFYQETGEPISAHNETEHQKEAAFNACYFVLNEDRQVLYDRIEKRIDEMMNQGLLDEVRALKSAGCKRGMVSMQGLGYKEILDYLEGRCTLEEAISVLKRDTRHFAKRQLTWFRRERDVIWLEKEEFENDDDKILKAILQYLSEKGI
ncbi:MAG: tRNA (adenosine(37)-N6)-dimethylallyltransferase MiaA [Lachnospiraceae bacterium]|nr:tRNA (adenosine(37)-N6)-dimethylallyltransferase MiaA [Lachnospiraceae bacterium]